MKKIMMKSAMPVLLLATITACGNFEWFPDNGSTSTTTTPSSTAQTATNTTVQKTQMGGAMQGNPLTLTTAVTTFAGSNYFADGTGAAARFDTPFGLTSDGTNLYVADTQNNTIRKIVIATGAVTTLAGTTGAWVGFADGIGAAASFNHPKGITIEGTNLYVADTDSNTIRKIVIATGAVTTLAGALQYGSADGIGTAARFKVPEGITSDGTNLYVADTQNNTIRKIVIATGEVTTLAGTAGQTGSADGIGAAARFSSPSGITVNGTNLYIADSDNKTIRKLDISTGEVTTVAGTPVHGGSTDGIGTAALFITPNGVTTDGTTLYIADSRTGTIRKLDIATGEVTTIAGTPGQAGSTDGTGATARFNYPEGLALAGNSLYVADSTNNTIRQIATASGVVTTLAGSAGTSLDGSGSVARFYKPSSVTSDGTCLYVADSQNRTIRKIVIATGAVTTLAGASGQTGSVDGTGTAARFFAPDGITTDGTNLYAVDGYAIRKIVIATGEVTTLAGTAGQIGSADGTGAAARFYVPRGITTDNVSLYVTDSFNHTIRKIVIATGEVTTLAGTAGQAGSTDGTGAVARFGSPIGITTDGSSVYVADNGNGKIRKIVIATGVVTTLASTTAGISDWLTTDGTSLYSANAYSIAKIVIATGAVTTLAGSEKVPGFVDGTGTAARFLFLWGGTTDGTSLYVVDGGNSIIRKVQ